MNTNIEKGLEKYPPLLRISQPAEVLNVSPWTLRNWDNADILKAVRMGSRKDRRYRKSDLLKFINSL